MRRLRLSRLAEADIEDILLHSQVTFGPAARQRYEALIGRALLAIATDPDCPGVRRREELAPGIRTYHLFHSRRDAGSTNGLVRSPRHLLIFRLAESDIVDVARLLHDSMDLPRHLPDSEPENR